MVFWVVALCRFNSGYPCLGRSCYLHLHNPRVGYKYGRLHGQVEWKVHSGWQENGTQDRPMKMVHK